MYSLLAFAAVLVVLTEQSLFHRIKRQCPCAELIANPCVCQVGLPRCTCLNVIPRSSCGCNAQAQYLVCRSSCENNCARTCLMGNGYVGCPSSCRSACSQSCAVQQPVRAPALVPMNLSCPNFCQQTCRKFCGGRLSPSTCNPQCRYECEQRCLSVGKLTKTVGETTAPVANAEQQSLQNSEQHQEIFQNSEHQKQSSEQQHEQELLYSNISLQHNPATVSSLPCPSACAPQCEPKCIFEHEQKLSQNLSLLSESAPSKVCSPVCIPSCTPDCVKEQEQNLSRSPLPIYLSPGNAPECITPCKAACTPQCVTSHQPSSAGQPTPTTTLSTTEVEHSAYDTQAMDATTQSYAEEITTSAAPPSFETDQQQQILVSQTPLPLYIQPGTPPTCIAPCMPNCAAQCINEHLEAITEQTSELSTTAAVPDSTTLQNPTTFPTPTLLQNATLLSSNSSYPCIESCMPTCDPQCILEHIPLIATTLAASSLQPADPLAQQEPPSLPTISKAFESPEQYSMNELTSEKQLLPEDGKQTTLPDNSYLADLQGKSSTEPSWNLPQNYSDQGVLAYPSFRLEIIIEEELLEKAVKCGCKEPCAQQCSNRQNREQCEKACQMACAQECPDRLQ